jgi:hypothetical protein
MAIALAVFLFTFLVLTAGGMWSVAHLPQFKDVGQRPQSNPPSSDWYIGYDRDGIHRDHYVFYGGYGSAIANARIADALILGSSRAQIGFLAAELAQFAMTDGLSFYNMGFGHGEGYIFAREVILQHNLRPRFLIVNADVGDGAKTTFFRDQPSPFAKQILKAGWWSATKYIYGKELGDVAESYLERVFPYFPGHSQGTLIYRSWSNGFWQRNRFTDVKGAYPVQPYPDTQSPEDRMLEQERAREFTTEMQARGSAVVFTWVPASYTNRERAMHLAAAAGVPFIAPVPEGLTSFDEGHLDLESAQRFSAAFLEEFRAWLRTVGVAGVTRHSAGPD